MLSVCGFEGISSVGDWSNGMIGVSKTFGGSSILSSPVSEKSEDVKSSLFFRIIKKWFVRYVDVLFMHCVNFFNMNHKNTPQKINEQITEFSIAQRKWKV